MSTAQETPQQDYDPADSIAVVDQAIGQLQADRQTHMRLSQEVQRLRQWCEDRKNGDED